MKEQPDFRVTNHGSIFLFHPRTEDAKYWLNEHCHPDGEHQYLGSALVVKSRYVQRLAELAEEDGLVLS